MAGIDRMAMKPPVNWNQWFEEKLARRRAEDQARIEQARREAQAGAREVFDFARLKELYDVEGGGRLSDRRLQELFERRYYLQFPNVKSLEEFAALLEQLEMWERK